MHGRGLLEGLLRSAGPSGQPHAAVVFRRWGIDRLLFGSDYLQFQPEETPQQALDTLGRYPFTQDEIDTIRHNDGSAWLGQ